MDIPLWAEGRLSRVESLAFGVEDLMFRREGMEDRGLSVEVLIVEGGRGSAAAGGSGGIGHGDDKGGACGDVGGDDEV